jgi:hypothetical protein
MYKIDRTDLGFQLTFGGDMTEAELQTPLKPGAKVNSYDQSGAPNLDHSPIASLPYRRALQ